MEAELVGMSFSFAEIRDFIYQSLQIGKKR